MSKELVIGSNRHETKVAILEDDQLVEVYFQRANEYSLAGSIHKGRVTRVLPGMQSAFVDLGLERDTFLYVSDFFEENEDIDTVAEETARPGRRDRGDRGHGRQSDRNRPPAERPHSDRQRVAPSQVAEFQTEALVLEDDREAPAAALRFDEEVDLPSAESPTSIEESAEPQESPTGAVLATGLSSNLSGGLSTAGGDAVPAGDPGENRGRGDRRHRRSRRRRNRGRGFPENKYAQPHNAENAEANTTSAREQTAENNVAEAYEADVLILPGESLAKYKRPAAANVEEEDEADRAAAQIIKEAEEQEAIQEEAEELALADKVFSHGEPAQPPPPAEIVTPVETEAAAIRESELPEPAVVAPVATEEAQPLTTFEPSAPLGTRVEDEEEKEPHSDSAELAAPAPGVAEPVEAAHEPEAEEFESKELEGEADQQENAEPQTAVLREGSSNRPLQRSSRRMRRRRGGNRFAQQQGDLVSAAMGSNGAGTATALEPETRTARDENAEEKPGERFERGEKPALPSISDLLKPGQEIIVQIAKEPLGQKGARITSHVALPGRYVVFMPSVAHLGVSRKIASEEERQRLKRILQKHRTGATGGFIVRTAGEGIPEDEIAADMNFLYSQWLDIRQKAEKKPAPALLHYDLDIVQRILRDQVTEDFKAIWVDNEDMYENVLTFMQRFQPALVNRVKMYTRPAPIFDAFGITSELEKALRPKVWLKSGGYIVINQTEALVAIDINTGKYVGKSNRLEDTIVKTNTEAVKEIVRQIRLRDLGGIIVVDFIDMDERKNRQKVMQALEEAMRADKAPYKILQFNDFGLVAITRKRVKQSLERTLCSPCPYCDGAGYVKSVQTIISEILVEAQKLARAIEGKDVLLRVHPEVAKVLKASNNRYLEELEEILARPVLVKGDPTLHSEKFDLA